MFLCIFQYDKLEELKDLWVGKPRFRRMEDSKKIFYKFLFLREINFQFFLLSILDKIKKELVSRITQFVTLLDYLIYNYLVLLVVGQC